MNKAIRVKNLVREYIMGDNIIKAVDDISFDVDEGSFVILLGASGAGKSTVLNILGGMDKPTSGEVFVAGQDISKYNKTELTKYRRDNIGFVFQFYNLMPNLTVVENVELATQICTNPLNASETLRLVGLEERENNFPSQISGGEQQRVAIARALAKNPDILLCDEPTGALDYKTGKSILELLARICRQSKKTVIIVTHNQAIAPIGDLVLRMKSGKIVSIEKNENPIPVESMEW
ncbi:MAG: putative ABC transporter ATP-binding protein [Firmicutes bacterium ADurb.Bin193]|nr:MAG: putative ABC transporter ATP-binding protein [Firmicutes bacterium ADurb.Bin193]